MLLDFLFPRKCLGCGRLGAYFCSQCLNFISLNPQRICPVCGRLSIDGQTHPQCLKPQSLDGLTAIFSYQGLIKKAIKKLKYRFISDLAEDLVELFLSFCGEDKAFTRFTQKKNVFLIPIPLHQKRLAWRGFNQAELLGEIIASNLNLNFLPNLLLRIKNTPPQAKLKKKERLENVKGAFKFNLALKRFKHQTSNILLFDDVWTTGATLKEAAKVLKRNGAQRVWGLTLAR